MMGIPRIESGVNPSYGNGEAQMISNVGVIGLGIIGKPIAARLVAAGFRVFVYDVRDEPVAELTRAGAIACTSSAGVAAVSDVIISLVIDF